MTLEMLEQSILEAERCFDEQLYLEGKSRLEEALATEPTYGKAHNHMGWLYLYPLADKVQAERHLRLALKYAPNLHSPYVHMSQLLLEKGALDEMEQLLAKAEYVTGVEMSFWNNEQGRLNEVKGNYQKAIRYYKEAIKWSLHEPEIQVYKANIRRCRNKRWTTLF